MTNYRHTLVSHIREVDQDRFYYSTSPLEGGSLLTIKDKKKKVGHLHFRIEDDNVVHMYTFFIEPSYRSKGIGRSILLAFLSYFVGFKQYVVSLSPFECAMGFYDKVLSQSPYSYQVGGDEVKLIEIYNS